jgi:hypothetical protein
MKKAVLIICLMSASIITGRAYALDTDTKVYQGSHSLNSNSPIRGKHRINRNVARSRRALKHPKVIKSYRDSTKTGRHIMNAIDFAIRRSSF